MPFAYILDVTLVEDRNRNVWSEVLNPSMSLRNIEVGSCDFSSFVTFSLPGYINQPGP